MIGVVGTRRPTPYGTAVAERIAGDRRARAWSVGWPAVWHEASTTAAHRGALDAGGDTVAVFGCGVDMVYPSENRKLAAQLAEQGLLVSEFPMGAPAYPQKLSHPQPHHQRDESGVVVVEGAQYSGSSITARLALDHGREVFGRAGNVTSKMSWGPNLLIKQGAKLVQDYNDVIVELAPELRRRLAEKGAPVSAPGPMERPSKTICRSVRPALPPAPCSACCAGSALHLDAILEKLEGCSPSN
jgi:DNA processing protein